MKDFEGNKTLLPLVPRKSIYDGSHPILTEILTNLPSGPKAVVVNYKKEDVVYATRDHDITYCDQPELNGTGGGLLAARSFIEEHGCSQLIITMGDVPFVKKSTYKKLVEKLEYKSLVVLGFRPEYKKEYGVLEIEGDRVRKITEWKYWKAYPDKRQLTLDICNSGIYAARKDDLLRYFSVLAAKPHRVKKKIEGESREVEEFFITDIVEYMGDDGLRVGYTITEDEEEVMGIDDIQALSRAQELFRMRS
jgi:bifunctional UDP-N-acetylglucosamine pyrophosphorylase/glucosamine-1-phosphate N-acetyltransferase